MPNIPNKLNIDLFDGFDSEYEHNRALAEHMEYCAQIGISEAEARAKWVKNYPLGKKQWLAINAPTLNAKGQQLVINKINELIEYLESINNPE